MGKNAQKGQIPLGSSPTSYNMIVSGGEELPHGGSHYQQQIIVDKSSSRETKGNYPNVLVNSFGDLVNNVTSSPVNLQHQLQEITPG